MAIANDINLDLLRILEIACVNGTHQISVRGVSADFRVVKYANMTLILGSVFKFLSIKFSPQNSAFSFSNRFIFQLFVIVFTRVGPFPEQAEHICRCLRKLTSNINLFQLKGQDLALSNDMHVFLQMTSIRSTILNSTRGV